MIQTPRKKKKSHLPRIAQFYIRKSAVPLKVKSMWKKIPAHIIHTPNCVLEWTLMPALLVIWVTPITGIFTEIAENNPFRGWFHVKNDHWRSKWSFIAYFGRWHPVLPSFYHENSICYCGKRHPSLTYGRGICMCGGSGPGSSIAVDLGEHFFNIFIFYWHISFFFLLGFVCFANERFFIFLTLVREF